MALGYFVLKNSNNTLERRFRVIHPNYSEVLEKAVSVNRTLTGNLDIAVGSVQKKYGFVVRVREEEPADGDIYTVDWGTLDDLRTFYSYNNPNGSPSNVLTMTDHYGAESEVIMMGDLNAQIMGILVSGTSAWFTINCMFQVIP